MIPYRGERLWLVMYAFQRKVFTYIPTLIVKRSLSTGRTTLGGVRLADRILNNEEETASR